MFPKISAATFQAFQHVQWCSNWNETNILFWVSFITVRCTTQSQDNSLRRKKRRDTWWGEDHHEEGSARRLRVRDGGGQTEMSVSQPALVQHVLQDVHLLQLSFQVLLHLHTQSRPDVYTGAPVTRQLRERKRKGGEENLGVPPHLVDASSQRSVFKVEFGCFHDDAAFQQVAEGEKKNKNKQTAKSWWCLKEHRFLNNAYLEKKK